MPIFLCPLVGIAGALHVTGMALVRTGVLCHLVAPVSYQEGGNIPVFCNKED